MCLRPRTLGPTFVFWLGLMSWIETVCAYCIKLIEGKITSCVLWFFFVMDSIAFSPLARLPKYQCVTTM
ncbi:hypothetical protein F5X98DRAFT_327579 [Xylaria grammica]|nr:hypothetical protein F5X98DRAFT_327579 [Xylaria grammica]